MFLLSLLKRQAANWKRSFGLIWATAPFYTASWFVLLIIQGLLPALLIYLTKLTVDSLILALNSNGLWENIRPAIFYSVATVVVMLLTDVFQSLLEMVRAAQADIVQDYLKNLVHIKSATMDMEHFESHEYHDRLEQATSEGISRPLILLESFGGLIQNGITLIFMGGLLVQYSFWLPIVLIVSMLPAFFIVLRFDKEYNKWWRETTVERRWIQYFDLMLTHPMTVAEMRVFDLSPDFREKYQNLRKDLRTEKISQMRRLNVAKLFSSVLSLCVLGASVAWIGWSAIYGALTLGDLALFYQAFTRGQGLIKSLFTNLSQMVKSSLFLDVLFEFLDLRTNIKNPEEPVPAPPVLQEGIRLNNATFRYPGTERYVFHGLSLFFPAGKVVAIVGENGSGKTTLLKLLCRFYDLESGSIEFDKIDIRKFSVRDLLKMITITFQIPLNYQATVRESIRMGDLSRETTDDEIEQAAYGAGAHDYVSRLPEKYDTLLGRMMEKGAQLSGGEWQRLALARSYFRQAPIVLLDEPTSFMDSWAESDWFQRLRDLVKNRTTVLITHRFTIAMRADVIFVMDKGKIIETGTHQELIKLNGFYAKSWKQQMQATGEVPAKTINHDEITKNEFIV